MMHAPPKFARAGVVSTALAICMLSAQAATPFVRSLAELSNADRQALERAQIEVLETMKPGATASWKDEKTGHYGEARLLRNYVQNGMPCGEVEHMLKITQMNRFVMPLCRTADGSWRLAY